MTTRKEIRVGLIGVGANMRRRHIPGLLETGAVELSAVCNRRRESGERAARDFGIARVYDRWEDLVADDRIDAVVVGTWPNTHAPITLGALRAGKHVLCEARMAMDDSEARAMLDAGRACPDLVKQLVPAPATLDLDAAVIRLLGEGYLGEVLAIEVREAGVFMDKDSPLHWRQDRALSGLNILAMGIWYETLLRWGFEAAWVLAQGRTFVARRRDETTGETREVTIPDHVGVCARMKGGASACMVHSAVQGLAPGAGAWLYGSEGTLHIAPGAIRGARRGDPELHSLPVKKEERRGWRVEADFVASILEGQPVRLTSFEDGVRYMDFTAAVARSMAGGKQEHLPPAP